MLRNPIRLALLLAAGAAIIIACAPLRGTVESAPIALASQGSFAVGGTVVQRPGMYQVGAAGADGQTLHGDHVRVVYQVPVNPRKLPLVMWHGFGEFSKTWETTPDGREGFQTTDA